MNQRQIKFRVWRHDIKRMNYDVAFSSNKNVPAGAAIGLNKIIDYIKECDFPLMQFTGLHDKNGKEIWEGDILNTPYFEREYDCVCGNLEKIRGCSEKCKRENELLNKYAALSIVEYRDDLGVYDFLPATILRNIKNYWSPDYFDLTPYERLEVIGNIYENPEMVGEGE